MPKTRLRSSINPFNTRTRIAEKIDWLAKNSELLIPVILMSYVYSIVVIPAEAGIQRKKLDSVSSTE